MVRSLIAAPFLLALFAVAAPSSVAAGQASSSPNGKSAAVQPKSAAKKAAKAKSPADTSQPAAQPPTVTAPAPAQPAPAAPAQTNAKTDAAKPAEGKVAPHFAALRADKVFLRSGPSSDFPVQWVFQRRGLPVEVLATFDIWRKIRAIDGTEGWVNQQMLTGRRSVLVTGGIRNIRRDPDPASAVVAQLEPDVVAALSHCNPDWCEVKAGGYKGWIKRDEVWGLEPGEAIP